jgi:hypothetical protein
MTVHCSTLAQQANQTGLRWHYFYWFLFLRLNQTISKLGKIKATNKKGYKISLYFIGILEKEIPRVSTT